MQICGSVSCRHRLLMIWQGLHERAAVRALVDPVQRMVAARHALLALTTYMTCDGGDKGCEGDSVTVEQAGAVHVQC